MVNNLLSGSSTTFNALSESPITIVKIFLSISSMIRSANRPWNSDSSNDDTMSISEDAEQLLITSLEEEVAEP